MLVFILDIPKQGNISSGYAFSLIGISPPRGSPVGALLCYDGFITLDMGLDASIIISSACYRSARRRRAVTRLTGWAELVRRSPACSAYRFPDSRRKVKDMLVFSFKGTRRIAFIPLARIRNKNRVLNTPKKDFFLTFLILSIFSFESTFESA